MEWVRGPVIGHGATATVSLATAVSSGELFAVKSMALCHSTLLQRENYLMSKLSCPRIVRYIGYDVVTNEANQKATYNLCMEYVAGGTLSDEIQRVGGRLGEDKVRIYSHQILQGLDYLHVNGVVHCDIKSQNVLIGEDGAKIADLGCAKLMGRGVGFDTSAFAGTPAFMAPEVARGEEQGFGADIWAFGCTIIEMSTGNSPWPELNDPVAALYKIGFSGDAPEIPNWLSEKGKDFVGKCLERDARRRWTAKELIQHPFLEELDTLSNQVKESTMNSPNSVLDPSFWDSLDAVESPNNLIPQVIASNSPRERIKDLLQPNPNPPHWTWTWTEDWITVRSSDIEENKEISSDASNAIAQDEFSFSFPAPSIFDPSVEDHEAENSIQSIIDFSSISISISPDIVLPFDNVTDEKFVSDNLNFESINESSCFLPIPSLTFTSGNCRPVSEQIQVNHHSLVFILQSVNRYDFRHKISQRWHLFYLCALGKSYN